MLASSPAGQPGISQMLTTPQAVRISLPATPLWVSRGAMHGAGDIASSCSAHSIHTPWPHFSPLSTPTDVLCKRGFGGNLLRTKEWAMTPIPPIPVIQLMLAIIWKQSTLQINCLDVIGTAVPILLGSSNVHFKNCI